MHGLFLWLTTIGQYPNDSEELRTQKTFLIYQAVFMSFGGLLWGSISLGYKLLIPSLIPYGYVVLSIFNLWFFNTYKKFEIVRGIQIFISLVLPFMFQWSLGGFLSSGIIMLWALLALIASLSFERTRSSLLWLVLFMILTAFSGYADDYFRETYKPAALPDFSIPFIVLNISVITAIVFGLVVYFVKNLQQTKNHLKDKQDEINDAYLNLTEAKGELEVKNEELESANNAKSQFLATISHEIRTPLNGIIGITDLLRESKLDEEQQKLLRNLSKSNTFLHSLINNVLDLSQIENDKLILQESAFPMKRELNNLAEVMGYNFQEKKEKINFIVSLDNALPEYVVGDVVRLKQVLLNLLNNAIKFTEKGQIWFSATISKTKGVSTYVRFEVKDTGIGITDVDRLMLFEKFYRVENFEQEGTGLGLTIANNIIKLMGGKLEVQSEEGKGSTFSFEVPFEVTNHFVGDEVIEDHDPQEVCPLKILVVEDNDVNRMVLQKVLNKCGCRNVTVTVNGLEAYETACDRPFDLILMDINMPVMNGLEATAKITQHMQEHNLPMPVIGALTANAFKHEIEEYLDKGMAFVLSKPYTQEELQGHMRSVQEQVKARQQEAH
ncbi:MAG: hypothetical protein CMP48_13375 [Rickettsiales bacterium]|nr:hypothetical protein [Rickettsiales bacterium]